jgi:hypothetical protein
VAPEVLYELAVGRDVSLRFTAPLEEVTEKRIGVGRFVSDRSAHLSCDPFAAELIGLMDTDAAGFHDPQMTDRGLVLESDRKLS